MCILTSSFTLKRSSFSSPNFEPTPSKNINVDLDFKGIRSVTVCVHGTFGRLGFVSNSVETCCTTDGHGILITAIN